MVNSTKPSLLKVAVILLGACLLGACASRVSTSVRSRGADSLVLIPIRLSAPTATTRPGSELAIYAGKGEDGPIRRAAIMGFVLALPPGRQLDSAELRLSRVPPPARTRRADEPPPPPRSPLPVTVVQVRRARVFHHDPATKAFRRIDSLDQSRLWEPVPACVGWDSIAMNVFIDELREELVRVNPHRIQELPGEAGLDVLDVTEFCRDALAGNGWLTLAILGPEIDHRVQWDPELEDAYLPRLVLRTVPDR